MNAERGTQNAEGTMNAELGTRNAEGPMNVERFMNAELGMRS